MKAMDTTATDWHWVEESPNAAKARALAVIQQPTEASFWGREDLLYLGDLSWTGWPGEGYEYIGDLSKRNSNGFQYTYGLVGLSDTTTVGQSLVCQVRNTSDDPLGLEMYVADTWQTGPLQIWLDSLPPAVQTQARSRYRNLVAWVRKSLQD